MPQHPGIIILFNEPARRKAILKAIQTHKPSFTDALSVPDWKAKKRHLALLSFSEDRINYLGIMKRGKKVITAKYRVEFSDLIDLQDVPIAEVEARLGTSVRQNFVRSASGSGGKIAAKTWAETIQILKELRPRLANDIDRLVNLVATDGINLVGPEVKNLILQKEAFGASLDIFGGSSKLRKEVLRTWAPGSGNVLKFMNNKGEALIGKPPADRRSFLSGISQQYIQEETALQNDLRNWPEFEASMQGGIHLFEQGDRRLEVVYANRNALERNLGVDLIYYNAAFQMFVLVQYKLMTTSEKPGSTKQFYRPDGQFQKELDRMNDFAQNYGNNSVPQSHHDFRLNNDGFFFKLVPNHGLRSGDSDLITGMYLTREYTNYLVGSDGPKGERGGKRIEFGNAPRYLSNTEFVNGVNRGWLGTNGVTSETIQKLVTQFLQSGKAVLVAVEKHKK